LRTDGMMGSVKTRDNGKNKRQATTIRHTRISPPD
jgi:hypothetical protein